MFYSILIQPLINILTVLYSLIPGHDFGIAIILLTILVRIVLWPFAAKALHGQKSLQEIQPEIEKLKKKYRDKQELNKALMELYKEKEINPLGSCLPSLIQIPFMLGLFYVLIKFKDPNFVQLADPSSGVQATLYPFVRNLSFVKGALSISAVFKTSLFGLINLAAPSLILAVLAALAQFVQSKMLAPKKTGDPGQKAMSQMTFLLPAITFIFALSLPAALPLYWLVTTVVAIIQQYLVMHKEVSIFETIKSKLKKS